MYMMRIGISDLYLGVITCRYWFDNERRYYEQELDYEWINFASDLLESLTAYATLYMFHFYIKINMREQSIKSVKQKTLFVNKRPQVENPPGGIQMPTEMDKSTSNPTFINGEGGYVSNPEANPPPGGIPDKEEIKLNDSFKEALFIENKSLLREDEDSSMGNDSSNADLVNKINKQLMAQERER